MFVVVIWIWVPVAKIVWNNKWQGLYFLTVNFVPDLFAPRTWCILANGGAPAPPTAAWTLLLLPSEDESRSNVRV